MFFIYRETAYNEIPPMKYSIFGSVKQFYSFGNKKNVAISYRFDQSLETLITKKEKSKNRN